MTQQATLCFVPSQSLVAGVQHEDGAASRGMASTSVGLGTEYGVHDTLRQGIRCVRGEVSGGHPLEPVLSKWNETQEELRFAMNDRLYGSHMSFRMKMESGIVGQRKRIPVLPCSGVALDVLSGRDGEVDFENFLGHPLMPSGIANYYVTPSVHDAMEHALGL